MLAAPTSFESFVILSFRTAVNADYFALRSPHIWTALSGN